MTFLVHVVPIYKVNEIRKQNNVMCEGPSYFNYMFNNNLYVFIGSHVNSLSYLSE